MKGKKPPKGKYAWTAKIGDKGQIVIPKEARDLFGMEPGDTVLLLGDVKRGLAIVRSDTLAHITSMLLGDSDEDSSEENEEE